MTSRLLLKIFANDKKGIKGVFRLLSCLLIG